ncbi:MAG: hypothetical protein K0Q51_483 [Rickettsiaceae bacterium]|jgi:hypothetical protein|nr:hypothetical protein [Rickettsiaceae bacterium]
MDNICQAIYCELSPQAKSHVKKGMALALIIPNAFNGVMSICEFLTGRIDKDQFYTDLAKASFNVAGGLLIAASSFDDTAMSEPPLMCIGDITNDTLSY